MSFGKTLQIGPDIVLSTKSKMLAALVNGAVMGFANTAPGAQQKTPEPSPITTVDVSLSEPLLGATPSFQPIDGFRSTTFMDFDPSLGQLFGTDSTCTAYKTDFSGLSFGGMPTASDFKLDSYTVNGNAISVSTITSILMLPEDEVTFEATVSLDANALSAFATAVISGSGCDPAPSVALAVNGNAAVKLEMQLTADAQVCQPPRVLTRASTRPPPRAHDTSPPPHPHTAV